MYRGCPHCQTMTTLDESLLISSIRGIPVVVAHREGTLGDASIQSDFSK